MLFNKFLHLLHLYQKQNQTQIKFLCFCFYERHLRVEIHYPGQEEPLLGNSKYELFRIQFEQILFKKVVGFVLQPINYHKKKVGI